MMRRFNYIQLELYPILALAGIILSAVWLILLIDIDWDLLKDLPGLVYVIAIVALGGIVFFLSLFYYCYAQIKRMIVKNITWEELDKELQELKKKS